MLGRQRPSRRDAVTATVFAVPAAWCVWAAGTAAAEPQPMPDRWTQFVTDDGWVVDVNTTNEVVNHIDNLAGASNSWQARVTLRSEARITGTGGAVIQDAQLESGYFVGCRTDSSPGVEVGADIGINPYQQINGQVYGGGYGQGQGGAGGGGGGGAVVSPEPRPAPLSGCKNTSVATSGCCSNPVGWRKFRWTGPAYAACTRYQTCGIRTSKPTAAVGR